MHRRLRSPFAAVLAVVALTLTACGGGADEGSTGAGDGADTTKIAAMFSGPTNDNDYNALGLAKQGKTLFYRDFLWHLKHSSDRFRITRSASRRSTPPRPLAPRSATPRRWRSPTSRLG